MAAIARVPLLPLLLLLLPLLAHGHSTFSVPELEARMYAALAGSPCVRSLTLRGELGCGNPGRALADAPIRRASGGEELDAPAAVLLPAGKLLEFLDGALDDANVVGVLVENTAGADGGLDDAAFPQVEFAPYENRSWIWNPAASGLL